MIGGKILFNKLKSMVLGLPKTIYINFKCLPIKQAIKLPIFLSNKVILKSTKGKIIINGNVSTKMITIGFGNVEIFDRNKSRSILNNNGIIEFNGKASIGHGSKISVDGHLSFGNEFIISSESSIVCKKRISFGERCIMSWDVLIMDSDLHKIYCEGNRVNIEKDVIIGNDVWIGCRCTLLKGTRLLDNVVVGANTFLNNKIAEKNCIVGGNPVKILKRNIYWKK